jgi:PncC family amidohydrolase
VSERLAAEVLRQANAAHLTLAVAEADTGGLVLSWLTAVPGSSAVLRGGVVPYADDLKRDLLGLDPEVIAEFGAVSSQVAEALARAVRQVSAADLGLASTGILGPGGARPGKPVGLSFVAVASAERVVCEQHQWHAGSRAANRRASGRALLRLTQKMLADPNICATLQRE